MFRRRRTLWSSAGETNATQACRTELPPLSIVSISEAASSWATAPPSVTSGIELRWAAAASSRIALASVLSMILFSVSDSSIDSQMASAACPAAPETLLMASSCCERIGGTESRVATTVSGSRKSESICFESSARLIWSSSRRCFVSFVRGPVGFPWYDGPWVIAFHAPAVRDEASDSRPGPRRRQGLRSIPLAHTASATGSSGMLVRSSFSLARKTVRAARGRPERLNADLSELSPRGAPVSRSRWLP